MGLVIQTAENDKSCFKQGRSGKIGPWWGSQGRGNLVPGVSRDSL